MMIAVRDRADTCKHGRPGSRSRPGGHRRHDGSAARVREIEDPACTPSSAACVVRRGPLHCSRLKAQTSSYWTVARAPVGCVPLSPAASCAEAFCGHFAAPRDFTSSVEQYANFLSHLFIQLADSSANRRHRKSHGGADFFGFACQNQRFPNDFYDQTISQGLGAGEAPNLRDFKAFELSRSLVGL